MKLPHTYRVFAADAVKVTKRVTVDGEELDAVTDGLAVQLVSDTQPTISLTLTGKGAEAFTFAEGDEITVTLGGAK